MIPSSERSISANDKIVFCDQAVALYRVHQSNTSMTRDVNKRVKNLNSQIRGGLANIERLKPPYLFLLQSEIFLLKAKVNFLQKAYFRTAIDMSRYWAKKIQFLVLKMWH